MLLTGLNLFSGACAAQSLNSTSKILFTYGDFYPEKISGYDIIVLEGAHFDSGDISTLKLNNETVLGYISMGEVNEAVAHFAELKDKTLGKNHLWNSHILDLEDTKTRAALMSIIAHNVEKGLDGMFLDNIDNYTKYGPTPNKTRFLVSFLQEVKLKYPEIVLMQNAGISVLNDTAPYIDHIAKESIATNYNFARNKYQLRKEEVFQELLRELQDAQKEYHIPIILIEYADSKKMKKKIKTRIEGLNWPVFIGKIDLQTIPALD
ncbi:Endo alpha-1,4 polygalactosaminidase, GH114 family (was erroneously annotated as Cys-tRNA synthetase) [Salegentibacter echinorum]|uniref:Endo alpha-1,4 polygalactosaminidase, GH114 family (Was erroneously annotated as Cys-tRNA synthetase) n=1 Tax=Salegentibacter echinorum TaxID=1073325 RepID=A0A1M5CIN2_SALEC|nr:endo alpha-1,4 polygalactosaminidase [Salegentibacter echinorum]SHF54614.1 Endo alpha-1,4 polygalactosaminidase, GH114 family (was erroneously annotated as Cys-tRNA synthetase) [Salegentibacter echinorum]